MVRYENLPKENIKDLKHVIKEICKDSSLDCEQKLNLIYTLVSDI